MYIKKTLYESIAIPSSAHSYSMAVDYMKKWFISKFPNNYFKTIHTDQRQILDAFTRFNISDTLVSPKPSLVVTPNIQFEYDRDKVDLYQSGINMYTRRSRLDMSFFKDYELNLFLGTILKQLEINFNFKIRVSTKAQQMDLYDYINANFRIGSTHGNDVDIDMHLPYNVMMQLARDAGFEVANNKVVNVIDFIRYLNLHSNIPILFKYRKINGQYEFFILVKEVYVHINTTDALQADDGEREGMVYDNYTIDMNCVLRYPAPKFFMYHSQEEHQYLPERLMEDFQLGVYNIKLQSIPNVNEKGWNRYINTECLEESTGIPLSINFKELLHGKLTDVIEYNNSIAIASDIFMDFKIYNNNTLLTHKVDWEKMELTTNENITTEMSYLVLYVNLEYMNNYSINKE